MFWLAALASVVGAQRQPIAFAGFHRAMDLSSLLVRYPRSSHELIPGAGAQERASQDDEKEWMLKVFRNRGASGTYVLWLAPAESHDHLYQVQAWIRDGTTDRLSLLFEIPLEYVKARPSVHTNEARYPPCDNVLRPLSSQYGRPLQKPPLWEEAIETFEYTWTDPPERTTLECGRYRDRKVVFAIRLLFENMMSH
jgi:hypothetical protein